MATKRHVVQDPNRFEKIFLPAGTQLVNTPGSDLVIEITDTYEVSETRRHLFVEPTAEAEPAVQASYSLKDVVVPGGITIGGVRAGAHRAVDFKAIAYIPTTLTAKVQVG